MNDYLILADVARRLGCDSSAVRRLILDGHLASETILGRTALRRDQVEAFEAKLRESLTLDKAAEAIGVSAETIRVRVNDGTIPGVFKFQRRFRIPRDRWEAFVDSVKVGRNTVRTSKRVRPSENGSVRRTEPVAAKRAEGGPTLFSSYEIATEILATLKEIRDALREPRRVRDRGILEQYGAEVTR